MSDHVPITPDHLPIAMYILLGVSVATMTWVSSHSERPGGATLIMGGIILVQVLHLVFFSAMPWDDVMIHKATLAGWGLFVSGMSIQRFRTASKGRRLAEEDAPDATEQHS